MNVSPAAVKVVTMSDSIFGPIKKLFSRVRPRRKVASANGNRPLPAPIGKRTHVHLIHSRFCRRVGNPAPVRREGRNRRRRRYAPKYLRLANRPQLAGAAIDGHAHDEASTIGIQFKVEEPIAIRGEGRRKRDVRGLRQRLGFSPPSPRVHEQLPRRLKDDVLPVRAPNRMGIDFPEPALSRVVLPLCQSKTHMSAFAPSASTDASRLPSGDSRGNW